MINEADKCIYSKFEHNVGVIIYLYVDNLLIFGTNIDIVNATKCFLASYFDMKDMGEANVIIEIKLFRKDGCFILSQSHYGESMLRNSITLNAHLYLHLMILVCIL